jgi:hypothetical protein
MHEGEVVQKVTVEELDTLIGQMFDQIAECEAKEAALTEENKKLASLEAKVTKYLEELGREDFKSPRGTVSIKEKWRVNLPKTDAEKAAFFDWLRGQGIFDKYATVNSNSLNSLYMAEWEVAKQEGRGMEFSLPGIGPATVYKGLNRRKASVK